MATARITKQLVDATHPGAKDKLVWDAKVPGFGLKVTPAGSKVFVFQYRIGGRGAKVRRYTIGKYGPLTPDKARGEAERLALLVAQEIDPQAEKVERRRKSIDLAFEPYVERFHEQCLKVKWKSSHAYAHSLLLTYAVPVLRHKPLPDITRQDIRAVLAPVKNKAATAHNLFSVVRRLLRWAVNEGDLTVSPIDGMEGPAAPPTRDRVLSDVELMLVWRAADELGYPFGPLVRLLIVTGARREEVSGISWGELHQETALWSLPASRAKNNEAIDNPLSTLAMAELANLAARSTKGETWPKRGLLLTTTGARPISGYSKAKKRLDAAITGLNGEEPLAPWTLHDLRRTLATGMQRLGVRFEVTEAILNHVSGSRSGVAGIYQRHNWAPEKKAALQSWSDHIDRLLTRADESNVVKFEQARR